MSNIQTFKDEDLTAYLDGEASIETAREIEAALEHDLTLQAQLGALTINTDDLRNAFNALLSEAPQMPTIVMPAQNSNWNFRQMAAAAVIALTVGLGAGTLIPEKKDTSWVGYVAAYQALYSRDTLAHIEQTSEEAKAELARVSAAIGKNFDYEVFASDENLDFKRSQILSFNGRPLIQLAFLSPDGKPYALCIIRQNGSDNKQMQLGEAEGLKAASWLKVGYEYVLIGGDDPALIEKTANYYSVRL